MADIPLIMDKNGRTRQMTAREYREATGRISAAPRNPQYMPGLNSYYSLQNRDYPAFPDRRRPGLSTSEAAQDAASIGYTIGAQGVRPNYRPNNPQAQMTDDEIRQANVNAAMANKTFEGLRRKYNRENPGKRMNKFGDIIEVKAKEPAVPTMKPGTFIDGTPGAASAKAREKFFGGMPKRDGTVAGAAGVDLEKLRPSFDALPTPPATTPAASAGVTAAQRRQMLRDAATGRMDKFTDGRLSEVQSSYGKGSVKMLKPGEARPAATVIDEFGKPETMTSYLERRKAIQGTKGMATDKSGKPVSRADFLAGWKAPQPNPRKA